MKMAGYEYLGILWDIIGFDIEQSAESTSVSPAFINCQRV
jgi:hypothetical protein